mgnify:FL=1
MSFANDNFVNESIPVTNSMSEDFFNGFKINNDSEEVQKAQGMNLEINQANPYHEKEDDEKNAMVLSLRPGTVGLSHLLGNFENQR